MPRKKKEGLITTEENLNQIEEKSKIVDLEKFYVNGQIENLDLLVEQKKKEIVDKIVEFNKLQTIEIKNADGEVVDTVQKELNPYLISTFFFKSINCLANVEPVYTSEKLAIVWELYMYLIEQVNINIGMFQPTLSHFAKFAGISTTTLKAYKNSTDHQMQVLVNKIYDETFDSNVLLAQNKKLSNRSTELRVKVENEVQEKPQVKVNVNVSNDVDLEQISNRLEEIRNFGKSVKDYKEQKVIEVVQDE